jgi:hypothetical protein
VTISWFYSGILGSAAVAHTFMAGSATREIIEHPLLDKWQKTRWLTITWMLPLLGPSLTSRKLDFEPASGKWDHGERMSAVGPSEPEADIGTAHTDSDHHHGYHNDGHHHSSGYDNSGGYDGGGDGGNY